MGVLFFSFFGVGPFGVWMSPKSPASRVQAAGMIPLDGLLGHAMLYSASFAGSKPSMWNNNQNKKKDHTQIQQRNQLVQKKTTERLTR